MVSTKNTNNTNNTNNSTNNNDNSNSTNNTKKTSNTKRILIIHQHQHHQHHHHPHHQLWQISPPLLSSWYQTLPLVTPCENMFEIASTRRITRRCTKLSTFVTMNSRPRLLPGYGPGPDFSIGCHCPEKPPHNCGCENGSNS